MQLGSGAAAHAMTRDDARGHFSAGKTHDDARVLLVLDDRKLEGAAPTIGAGRLVQVDGLSKSIPGDASEVGADASAWSSRIH